MPTPHRNASTMHADTLVEGSNLLGAFIFFSYIGAALVLTATVVYDLHTAYHGRRTHCHNQDLHPGVSKYPLPLRLTLASLSFTTLSYHMLSFLIDSYSAWSVANKSNHPLPTSILGKQSLLGISGDRAPLEIWNWTTSSTLFQDFAESIGHPARHYWWTQKALVFSFLWNIYMAEKGMELGVRRLWVYFALGQILPVSFTMNLFLGMCVITPSHTKAGKQRKSPQTALWMRVVTAALYIVCLIAAPRVVNTRAFFPVLFATRMLLLSPWLLRWRSWQDTTSPTSHTTQEGKDTGIEKVEMLILGFGLLLLDWLNGWQPSSISAAFDALNDSHTVSALGYDLIIGLCSAILYLILG